MKGEQRVMVVEEGWKEGGLNAAHADEVGNGVKWKRPKTLKQQRQQQQQPLSLPFENRTHTHRQSTHT